MCDEFKHCILNCEGMFHDKIRITFVRKSNVIVGIIMYHLYNRGIRIRGREKFQTSRVVLVVHKRGNTAKLALYTSYTVLALAAPYART